MLRPSASLILRVTLGAVLLVPVLATADVGSDWASELDRRHAHFELAGADSLESWRLLDHDGASARSDSSAMGLSLRQLLAWSLGDSTAAGSLTTESSDDLAALQAWYDLDAPTLAHPMPDSAAPRLAWAAHALRLGEWTAAAEALRDDVPQPWRPLRWTLQAELERATGDSSAERKALERVVDSQNAGALGDRAALRLATAAIARADTAAALSSLDRVRSDGPLADRASFLRILLASSDDAASWEQFRSTHPGTSLGRQAALRAAALRLDEGARTQALEIYEGVLDEDQQRRTELESLSRDGGRAVSAVWAKARSAWSGPSDTQVAALASKIVASWFDDFPAPDDDAIEGASRAEERVESGRATGSLSPTLSDLQIDAERSRLLRAAVLVSRDAKRSLENWIALEASEHRRLSRADLERADAESTMNAAESKLALSTHLADSTRTRWLKMRDRAVDRLRQRSEHLQSILSANRALADRIDFLYLRGPMARLEHRDLESIPLPSTLVANERELQAGLDAEATDFTSYADAVIRRSVEEVLLPSLFARLDSTASSTHSLRARQDSVAQWIGERRRLLEHSPARQHAESVLAAARAHADSLAQEWSEFRSHRALEIVHAELDTLDRDGEAPLYGAAVSALDLAFATGDDPSLLDTARARMEKFLERYPQSPARSDIRYRLADLLLVTARADFQRRMGRYLEDGATNPALMPLWNVEEPIALYESILADDPDFDRHDRVLFQLGMLHADLADGLAAAPLARLIEEHPQSPLLAAAHLRLGELAFENKAWSRAAEHLEIAAESDDPSTRVVALYKLGWSRYALDDFDRAADRFLDLLDLYDDTEDRPQLGFDIATESRDLLVRSLARAGGASAFTRAFARHGQRSYEAQVLLDLGALLEDYALAQARDEVDQRFLELFPTHPAALTAAQRRLGHLEDDADRVALADRFLPTGEWAQAQSSDSLTTAADHFARGVFEVRAQTFHRGARGASSKRADWVAARRAYEDLLARWPDQPLHPRWQLLAAECAAATDDWPAAIDFAHSAAHTDSTELRRRASWQAVALSDRWYRSTQADSASTGADSLANRLVAEMDVYRNAYPDETRSVDLQWRAAQLEWAHQHLDAATARLKNFAVDHPTDERSARALRSRAEIYYEREDFERASSAFADAVAFAQQNGSSETAELENWVVHCEYRGAQAASEDSTRTADDIASRWQRVGDLWPTYVEADKAFYNAGSNWPDPERSRRAFRRVWTDYPDSPLRNDAARNLASSFEASGDLGEAARVLRDLARVDPRPSDAADLLLYAVDLYERSNQSELRDRTLDEYLQMFPDDLQTRSAVLAQRATSELDGLTGAGPAAVGSLLSSPTSNLSQLLAMSKTDEGLVPPSIRARVDFLKAESLREDYLQLTLSQPLESSIEKKQSSLTRVLAAYSKVSESHRAPWAQAAAFRSGEALLAFGDALRKSERPPDLSGEDLLAYDEVIEEQAWNFYDRAEDALKQLLISDAPPEAQSWVELARERFYRKTSERYLHMPSFDFPLVRAEPPDPHSAAR